MFGLGDAYIAAAVLGSISAAVFGMIYGAVNWNKGADNK